MMSVAVRGRAVAMLEGLAAPDGGVSNAAVRQVSTYYGVSSRSVRRYWSAHLDSLTRPVVEDDEPLDDIDVLAVEGPVPVAPQSWWQDPSVLTAVAGSNTLHAAWQSLRDNGDVDVPGYASFTRTLRRRLDTGVYGAITRRGGREGYLSGSLFLSHTHQRRNECWQADAQEIPVDVISQAGGHRIKPWQTTVIDDATRVVVASVITATRPTSDVVMALLVSGIRGRQLSDGTFVGGIPESIQWDNGREFINEAVTTACSRLGIQARPCGPYSPWQKGKIERWHRTIQEELYDHLAGATHGPRTFTGRAPWRGQDRDVLDLPTLIVKAQTWIESYNCDRTHSALAKSPAEAWRADPTVLARADEAILHEYALAEARPRRVNKDGISVHGIKYLSAGLAGIVGRKVEVRTLPNDTSVIAVFVDGSFHCEAYPATELSDAQRVEILEHRRQSYRAARQLLEAGAAARFRARAHAPVDDPAPPEDLTHDPLLALYEADRDEASEDEHPPVDDRTNPDLEDLA